ERVQGIRGIGELINHLISDQALAAKVSATLAHNPRTAGQRIGVDPRLGHVFLRGRGSTNDARVAAGEGAKPGPGGVDVDKELVVDPLTKVIPELAGVTNNEDLVPGGR